MPRMESGDFRGDGGGDFRYAPSQGPALINAIHQADRFGFVGVEAPAGVGQLAHDAVGHQLGQALQRAHVRSHAHVDLLHREVRFGCGIAHVAAGDEIDAAADAGAMDRGDDRLAAAFDAAQRVLQVEDRPAQLFPGTAVAIVPDLAASGPPTWRGRCPR